LESATLQVAHFETGTIASLELAVNDGGNTLLDLTNSACAAGKLCISNAANHEDDIDLTQALQSALVTDPSALQNLTVSYAVKGSVSTTKAHLDGAVLKLKYAPPGNFRVESGCAVLPNGLTPDDNTCNVLTIPPMSGDFYLHGTVYAPLASLDVTTVVNDAGTPVQVSLSRGVVSRNLDIELHPGNGSSDAFNFGRSDSRIVLLTAKIGGTAITRTLVRFDDASDVDKPGSNVFFDSWEYLR
jgi:hypothetical protein